MSLFTQVLECNLDAFVIEAGTVGVEFDPFGMREVVPQIFRVRAFSIQKSD